MSHSYFSRFIVLPCVSLLLVGSSILLAETASESLRDAINAVNAQAPQSYDPLVTPLPDGAEMADMPTLEILRFLDSWNPALREKAAAALGKRGEEAVPVLMKAVESKSGTVRAGASRALAVIIKQKIANWKQVYPEMSNAREAHQKILVDHADLAETFIRLARDERLDVRNQALMGLSVMSPKTPEAARAVLQLTKDEDVHLAQQAMVELNRTVDLKLIDDETLVAGLKEAMRFPMPNGRGHVVQVISRLDARMQRALIPELLAHLDWQPMRDTMFGAGGQEEAIKILTKLGVVELVPRLPDLMFKGMRGPGLFMPCLDSAKAFGRDAKVILTDLRAILTDLENKSASGSKGLNDKIDRLKETIVFLEKK